MRTKLIAAIAAIGAFALVACSSNGSAGTASPASTPASSPTTGAPASSADTGGGAVSSSGAGAAQSSQPADTGSATDSEQSTVTLSGGLDAQTGVWFSAFCTTLGPGLAAASDPAMETATGAAKQAAAVKTFNALGDAYSNAATALKPLPPPSFDGGEQFASEVVAGLSSAGAALKDSAAKIQAVDPTDQAALDQAIEAGEDSMNNSMSSLEKYDMSEDMQNAFDALPACQPFVSDDSDSGGTTTG